MFDKVGTRLDTIYSKRLNRVALQLLMFFIGAMYATYFAPYATQANTGLGSEAVGIETSFAAVDWFCFILLCRTLFFDRIALCVGMLAGFCWLFVGDAVALPFWQEQWRCWCTSTEAGGANWVKSTSGICFYGSRPR